MDKLSIGDSARWKWFNGFAEGKVLDVRPERTEIISKGKLITRNGTDGNPAVIILHKNGSEVLKLLSELEQGEH